MTSPCSRIFSTTARDLRIRSRDSSVNSMRSFPVATAFNCASEIEEGRASARPDEKNLVPPKNGEAEKGQAAKDLAFRLKLSAGGGLFRVGTHRRRRRPRGHCFFFFRTSAQG